MSIAIDDFVRVLDESIGWEITCHEKRPRPPGASSGHHVDDVVLCATRNATPSI
ncbi:MAG: hypothetical protein AB8G26_12300 [Ilumatobacter sp.]